MVKNKIYISSTYKDLVDYRSSVHAALRKMGYEVCCMEDYVAKDERTDIRCRSDAANCDIYIGIFAWRYGFIPKDENIGEKSITELEYIAAKQSDRATVLTFLIAEDVSWNPQVMDSVTGENQSGKRILELRNEIQTHSPAYFRNPDDLATQVVAAVYQAEAARSVSRPELFYDNYVTFELIQGSGIPGIDQMVERANDASLVMLKFGPSHTWWTTRLHLVSALATDFTKIQAIVFVDEDEQLYGIYSPHDVRHALAIAFPAIEIAYLQSVRAAIADGQFHASFVVEEFEEKLEENSGGKTEKQIKHDISKQLLNVWFAGRQASEQIELREQSSLELLHEISTCDGRFVALIKSNRVIRVIDRIAAVNQLARRKLDEMIA